MAAEYEMAVRRVGDDAELAAVAKQAWLRLLRHHGSATGDASGVRVAEVVVHLVQVGPETDRSLLGDPAADGDEVGASPAPG